MNVKKIALAIAQAFAAPLAAYAERNLVLYGVVNTKSTAITNGDATPPVQNKTYVEGARVYESVGTVEVAAADSDTSVFRFCRVRSSDRISSIEVANDAITGGTSYDLGLHRTAADGGAAVDVDLFASAVDLSTAHAFTDYTYEATATNISAVESRLWELLGLSADPLVDYDVTLYANTVGSGVGTISMRVKRVKGS